MGTSHTESFTPEHLALAELFKALGHPARLAIVHAIAAQQACVCGEFVEITGLSQATVSQHLMRLRAHGLVAAEREGRVARYRVAHAGCLTILGCIRAHFAR